MIALPASALVSAALFAVPLTIAALWDLIAFRIPNVVTVSLAGGFLVGVVACGCVDAAAHLLASAAVLGLGAVAFSRGWLGGGDAKLMAATVLWLGPQLLMPFFLPWQSTAPSSPSFCWRCAERCRHSPSPGFHARSKPERASPTASRSPAQALPSWGGFRPFRVVNHIDRPNTSTNSTAQARK